MNGQQRCAAAKTAEHTLGIVLTVDRAAGALTLGRVCGKRSHLTAPPHLLRGVRRGTPVQVVVEGATVRTLRCL